MTLAEKKEIFSAVLEEVQREQNTLIQAALIAREAATHEESIAEDKYDTRGLEASYLAGAQAKKAQELQKTLYEMGIFKLKDLSKAEQVELGAIIRLDTPNKSQSMVFLLPWAGGTQILRGPLKIQVVTPASPLGREILGRAREDDFELITGTLKQSIEIIDFY